MIRSRSNIRGTASKATRSKAMGVPTFGLEIVRNGPSIFKLLDMIYLIHMGLRRHIGTYYVKYFIDNITYGAGYVIKSVSAPVS